MRVYTWGAKRKRYETAFVESNFCGLMPVEVTPGTQPGGDATISLCGHRQIGKEERAYRMHQTLVRRTDENRAKRRATPKRRIRPERWIAGLVRFRELGRKLHRLLRLSGGRVRAARRRGSAGGSGRERLRYHARAGATGSVTSATHFHV